MDHNDVDQIGRLALRIEGEWWVAYYALLGTMNGAIQIGRIHMRFVQGHPKRKADFMLLMREVVGDIVEEKIGVRPVWPDPPQSAPEHERSGSA